jgi:hypothetical protein
LGNILIGSAFFWLAGGAFHSLRTTNILKKQHEKEKNQLMAQHMKDASNLSNHIQKHLLAISQLELILKSTISKYELKLLQSVYEDFQELDIDGDDRVSRAEFNLYMKKCFSTFYPGLEEKDYPDFEGFDDDGNGYVR